MGVDVTVYLFRKVDGIRLIGRWSRETCSQYPPGQPPDTEEVQIVSIIRAVRNNRTPVRDYDLVVGGVEVGDAVVTTRISLEGYRQRHPARRDRCIAIYRMTQLC